MSPIDRLANLHLNRDEFIDGKTKLKSLPPVLFVELTQNCNLHCHMCRATSGYQVGLNMSDKIFDKIAEELFPSASLVDLRGWGESTILPNFEGRITRTVAAGPKLRLVTNALAVSPNLWSNLMDSGAVVAVSVDAATAGTMKSLGRGSFDKLIRSLESAVVARDASKGRGCLQFNTVVSSTNLSELELIVELASRFGVSRITMFPVVAPRKSPLHLHHRKAEIPNQVKVLSATANRIGVEVRFGASLHEELVVPEALPKQCSHLWEYCYIDYSGKVGYCDHLIGHSGLMIGDLLTSTFDEIWNGTQLQELRGLHSASQNGENGELSTKYPHCAWCYVRRYVDFEDDTYTDPGAHQRVVSTAGRHPLIGNEMGPFPQSEFMAGQKVIDIAKTSK